MAKLDFEGLNRHLLVRIREIVTDWAPGGKVIGQEYKAGAINGGAGESFSINLNTAKWSDFATLQKGGDLISLYGEIHGKAPGDAFRELAELHNYAISASRDPANTTMPEPMPTSKPDPVELSAPGDTTVMPIFTHKSLGEPTNVWTYRDRNGSVLFYIARYDTADGKKEFRPFSWAPKLNKWVNKSWPDPRPLYGLEFLNVDKPVLIVEGEKSADAARLIVGDKYSVVSWPGGAQALNKTDWAPIYDKRGALLWPDADQPGLKAMQKLAGQLTFHLPEVKLLIDPAGNTGDGWDAADALADGWDWERFKTWAKPIAQLIRPPLPPAKKPEVVERSAPQVTVTVEQDMGKIPTNVNQLLRSCGVELVGKDNHPLNNESNMLRVLENFEPLRNLLWYDEFFDDFFTRSETGVERPWTDEDSARLLISFQRGYGFKKLTMRTVNTVVNVFGYQNRRNKLKSWLNSLVWDGTSRIESFLIDCFGAEDSPYTRTVARNFFIALAGRGLQPGLKFDNVLILEGKEDIGKTRACMALAGEFFGKAASRPPEKDFLISLRGKLLIELGEMANFKGVDWDVVKDMLSSQFDHYRSPHATREKRHPRACVFIGTKNPDTNLMNLYAQGARRFWPVWCEKSDVERIERDRDQLFAEAVHRFKAGEKWYDPPEGARIVRENMAEEHPWQSFIENALIGRSDRVRPEEIMVGTLQIDRSKLNDRDRRKVCEILRHLGWDNKQHKHAGEPNKNCKCWRKASYLQSESDKAIEAARPARVIPNYAPGYEHTLNQ